MGNSARVDAPGNKRALSCDNGSHVGWLLLFDGVYLKAAGASKESQCLQRQKLRMFWKGTVLFLEVSFGQTCRKLHTSYFVFLGSVACLFGCPPCWPCAHFAGLQTNACNGRLTV